MTTDTYTEFNNLCQALHDLTRNWNSFEDVPMSQQYKCREIGKQLNTLGGKLYMTKTYYLAKALNPDVHVIQAYWDGIGDWQW